MFAGSGVDRGAPAKMQPRVSPSQRICELAQHKTSKCVWATTPCARLSWGDQEPIRPLSAAALRAVPSARIQLLAQPKADHTAQDHHLRKEVSVCRKSRRPSSEASQHQLIVRLSTPRSRSRGLHQARPPHMAQYDVRAGTAGYRITPRLLQLATPKGRRDHCHSPPESLTSITSMCPRGGPASRRLAQLSLPRLRENNLCYQLGRPEEPIRAVSRAARQATASIRLQRLAAPKQLSDDYIPPREPEWNRNNSALA